MSREVRGGGTKLFQPGPPYSKEKKMEKTSVVETLPSCGIVEKISKVVGAIRTRGVSRDL